jgi:AraC-like DNA-binding protein
MRHSRGSAVFFKSHLHHTLGIGAVDQGEVSYTVNGKEASLAPGSLVIINPETLHACNPANQKERSYYMLHLDMNWCFQVQESMWQIDRFVGVEKIRIDDEVLYGQYCKTSICLMDETIDLQEKEQMLFDLVSELFSVACSPQTIKTESRYPIEKLKLLLAEDLQKDLPLNFLADKINANPYTLIRSFKAVTGITPHAYRMNCRIERARELLRQGWDIAETALECGFFDQSHFHRYFKAMTTITPKEYLVNFIQ